jgi:guanylate kinase
MEPGRVAYPMPIELVPEGMLIILSSPSGGGKSSICRALLAADPRLDYSISTTSRQPRGDEQDGREYHFVEDSHFMELVSDNRFYEWARVHGNLYGTRRDLVDAKLAAGKDVVLDIDVTGGLNIKKITEKAVLIFVLPPSMDVLEQRLRARNTDRKEEIERRLQNARNEIWFAQKYDYAVVNSDLHHTIDIIRRIIDAERHSSRHQRVLITGVDSVI